MNWGQEEDEETVPVYGTALPPLERQENAPKKADLDLTVRDEKGRRRFHGAFTGGFSAGYYNTVGSAEGWVPSQFLSNRKEKWDKELLKKKPEDFMDPEDLGVFGIAPRKVQTTEKFTESSQVAGFAGFREPGDANKSVTDVLKNMLKPSTESVGVKLFKVMRRGNRYKGAQVVETQAQSSSQTGKVYGPTLPSYQPEEEDYDDPVVFTNFVVPYQPKGDLHGIGYKPLIKPDTKASTSANALTATLGGKRLKISGEAFGYGALSDEEDLDEDAVVYGKEDLSQYDFAIGPSLVEKEKKKKLPILAAIDSDKARLSSTFVAGTNKFTVSNFLLKSYPLPTIPRNWKPKAPFSAKKRRSRWDVLDPKQDQVKEPAEVNPSSTLSKPKHVSLNANARAVLLGEEVVRVVATKVKEEPKEDNVKDRMKEITLQANQHMSKFAKSSHLSGFFASKFVYSSNKVDETKLEAGLTQAIEIPGVEKKPKKEEVEDTPFKTQRSSFQWHPHGLVSRRFNIPPPYPQFPDVVGVITVGKQSEEVRNRTSIVGSSDSKKPSEVNIFGHLFGDNAADKKAEVEQSNNLGGSTSLAAPTPQINQRTKRNEPEAEEQVDEAGEETRPPMDLFKAIFASSDEEDDDADEENKDKDDKKKDKDDKNQDEKKIAPEAQLRPREQKRGASLSVPVIPRTGIFANIDFDELDKSFRPALNKVKGNEERQGIERRSKTVIEQVIASEEEDDYGPVLPPPPQEQAPVANSAVEEMPGSNGYRKDRSSEKRKRKREKKQKHKSKKKRKKGDKRKESKKRTRKASTSPSSSDSEDSEDSDVDIKLLQVLRRK